MYTQLKFGETYIQDGVDSMEKLLPYARLKNDKVERYWLLHMNSIVNVKIQADQRDSGKYLFEKGIIDDEEKYCDFWHYQMDAVFRGGVINRQTNSIYVGTKDGVDLKKLKVVPNKWQMHLLEVWNETFHCLADKHGWIKVEIWW